MNNQRSLHYHQTLGIPQGSNKDAIKKAYRELAKKYHPDINSTRFANEKFIAIQEAYESLMNDPVEYSPKINYSPGSFESFLYRTSQNQKRKPDKKEESTIIKGIKNTLFWIAHSMFFIIAIFIIIITIRNAIVIGPEEGDAFVYYVAVVFIEIIGIVLIGATVLSFISNRKK